MAAKKAAAVVEVKPDAEVVKAALAESRPPCLCGCGGFPKGKNARFIPGHDARYHAAIKKAQAEAAPAATEKPTSTKRPAGASRPAPVKENATESVGSEA